VLDGWLAEKDEERRARFKRVLVKVCGEDAGEDATAWRTAVEKAQARARAARVKPK
jgi:hypothetical protein